MAKAGGFRQRSQSDRLRTAACFCYELSCTAGSVSSCRAEYFFELGGRRGTGIGIRVLTDTMDRDFAGIHQ